MLDLQDLLGLNLDIGALSLTAAGGLMDHYFGVRQRYALALCSGGEEKSAHRRGHADADGGDIGLDILHGIIYRKTGGNAAAGAVDIELYVFIRILSFKIQELCHDEAGGGIVYDSDEYDEYVETMNKMMANHSTIVQAEELWADIVGSA